MGVGGGMSSVNEIIFTPKNMRGVFNSVRVAYKFSGIVAWDYHKRAIARASTCTEYKSWKAAIERWIMSAQCKNTIPKILNKYSQKRKCAATVLIPTFMFRWAIYIFLSSVCFFCCRIIGGPIVGIHRSLTYCTYECGNWDWGRAIIFLGIHKSKLLSSAFSFM